MKKYRILLSLPVTLLWCAVSGGCGQPIDEISPADPQVVQELAELQVAAADWPWWRGPGGDGQAVGPQPPVSWSESENVVWKAPLPGSGHASPIVWGASVWVAAADEAQQTQSLLCLDRSSGKLRWEQPLHRGDFMHKHTKNSHASATPACDGERVFTVFMVQDGLWVTATDLQGNRVWQTQAGPFKSTHGYGSSPVLYQSLVIVAADNAGSGFLTALHRENGEIVWRVRRANKASFATPVIAEVAGRPQLLLSGQDAVTSYDPATGQQLWTCSGPASTTANTMAWKGDLVFASGGYPQNNILAIRGDGSGQVVWQLGYKAYVPSPLVIGERLLVIQDNGIARCLQADSGNELWNRRLGGNFSASPVLAGRHVYVPNEQGKLFVFKADSQFELVAENYLEDGGFASPVICGGQLFLRTANHLYCIGH